MRTYAIISLDSLDAATFEALKLQGVEQSSMNTIRKSNDGTLGILKWSNDRPAGLSNLNVLFEGSLSQLQSELQNNENDWGNTAPI